jgi:hypothetical protein
MVADFIISEFNSFKIHGATITAITDFGIRILGYTEYFSSNNKRIKKFKEYWFSFQEDK